MRKELQNIRQFDLMLVIEFFSTRWQGESIDLQWEIFKILIECLKKQPKIEFTAAGNTRSIPVGIVWQFFLYSKKREIFPEKKQWSNQPQNVMFVVKVFWWLCTENFGPLRIPRPATNFLPQKKK